MIVKYDYNDIQRFIWALRGQGLSIIDGNTKKLFDADLEPEKLKAIVSRMNGEPVEVREE